MGGGLVVEDLGSTNGTFVNHEQISGPTGLAVGDVVHLADSPRYRMLASLNAMIADMGVKTLIEGVEDERTVELCRQIGMDFMQGFFFSRPRPILHSDAA